MKKFLSAAIVVLMIVCMMACMTALAEETCNHNWSAVKEATCTANGARGCSVCGVTEAIPATGHSWSAVKEATCTANGARGCSVCGVTEAIPATGHSWSAVKEPTCGENGARGCSICGATEAIEKLPEHTFGAWAQTKAPTTTEEGEESRVCGVCGEKETRPVAKLEPQPTEKPADPTEKPVEPTVKPTEKPAEPTAKPTTKPTAKPTEKPAAKKNYYQMNVSSIGPRFKDVSELTDDWFMFSAVDLSKDGVQTLDLIAGNVHKIGTVTLTVAEGAVTVDYDIFVDPITVNTKFFTFFADLASIETINTDKLTGNAFGEAIALGEDTNLIFYLQMNVVYARNNDDVVKFNGNSEAYVALVEEMTKIMD